MIPRLGTHDLPATRFRSKTLSTTEHVIRTDIVYRASFVDPSENKICYKKKVEQKVLTGFETSSFTDFIIF